MTRKSSPWAVDAGELAARLMAPPAGAAVALISGAATKMAVAPAGEPITEHTPFEAGSVGKTMTDLVLARLARAGRLSLDSRVGDCLEAGRCNDITLRQLATHTSGLPAVPPGLTEAADYDPTDPYAHFGPRQLLKALPKMELGPEGYSNLGYQLLGHVLELVTNQSLNMLVQQHIFRPLGMRDSGPVGERPAVQGYDDGEPVPQWSAPLPGDGGWQCSLADLVAYTRAQLAGGEHSSDLGWGRAGDIYGHDGGTGGCSAFVGFNRQAGTGIVLLTNSADADVTDLGVEALPAL